MWNRRPCRAARLILETLARLSVLPAKHLIFSILVPNQLRRLARAVHYKADLYLPKGREEVMVGVGEYPVA
jgi:hypothetical protein